MDLAAAKATLTVTALGWRYGINLGLLALAGGLTALALVEPGRERPTGAPPLLELAAESIERIAVERPGQTELRFERRAGRWWLTAPEAGPANPVLLRSLLAIVEARCAPSYRAAEMDLPRLRLEPPRLRLWLDRREIRFGDLSPTDGQRYVGVGATVHLCPDQWLPVLTSAAGSFLAAPIEPAARSDQR